MVDEPVRNRHHVDPASGAARLEESPLTGEDYLDDDATGVPRHHVRAGSEFWTHCAQAARPGADRFRRHGRDRASMSVAWPRLRDHFGLEKRPVKVHEPFQMLGLLDEDLKQVLGIDVEGVFRRQDDVRVREQGLEALGFQRARSARARHVQHHDRATTATPVIYPEGDLTADPSGRMPKGFHFFDAIIRQQHFDDATT